MAAHSIPVDQIMLEAAQIRFWRVVATVLAVPFFVVGWVLAKAWFCVAFAVTAVKVGFRQGSKPRSPAKG